MAEETKKTTKEIGQEIANIRDTAKAQAGKNVIESRFGKRKIVTLNEGKENEQQFLLVFPGTVAASNIMENSANPFGNVNRTAFMTDAITSVVKAPNIPDLGWFDTHAGFADLFDAIYSFLSDGLN